ncbi:hypothetical protein C1752_10392 [Acaryochloris thomasi RCC1774]|uniref:DUF8173 domain-containing protein n=1 Tax=Acaryochloris thomasi RCC1774 TaxID=1764569 RepID=A0A2W1JN41_9CYAN|nr:polymer-forming cytoskeletal protein [Acaryochloris thomasi]PZD70671.1 hypothetical protein C1752_10392 [Acaryochloris thomasi RCC1774]
MKIKQPRRNLKHILCFLASLFVAPFLLSIAAIGSPQFQTGDQIIVGAQEVIADTLYATGDRITLDGTLKRNVFAAGDIVTLTGTVDNDVYLAGETITIDGIVKGDAIVAGALITLNGDVEGDLIAAGQSVVVNGIVKDDVRIAGQSLLFKNKAQVTDDVIAAGFSFESQPQSTIGGSLNLASGQTLLAGTINQHVVGGAGGLTLSGTVGQDMTVAVGDQKPWRPPFAPRSSIDSPNVAAGLTLTDSARIKGQLTYKAQADANISDGAQVAGTIVREPLPNWEPSSPSLTAIIFQQLQRLLTVGLVGCFLLWRFPNWTQGLAQSIQTQPIKAFGWGIVTSLVVGVVGVAISTLTTLLFVLLIFTLSGLAFPVLGVGALTNLALLVGFGSFASLIAPVVISNMGGHWLLKQIHAAQATSRYTSFLVGLILLVLLTAIPLVGGILSLIVILMGLGALWKWGASHLPQRHPPAQAQLEG